MDEHLAEAQQKLDSALQAIFQISTGALALSITFSSEIAPEDAKCKWILSIAWLLLAIVPVSYVFLRIMECSKAVFWSEHYRELNEKIKRGEKVEPMEGLPRRQQLVSKSADFFWRVMLSAFVLGVITFLVFGIINN